MPKSRKCDQVPEILRRLEYLEQLHEPSPMQQQLNQKYYEIESQQQAKFEYLADRAQRLDCVREELTAALEEAAGSERISEQEDVIESLQKQLDVRVAAFEQLYVQAQRVLGLPDVDGWDSQRSCAAMAEIEQGLERYASVDE